MKKKKLFRLFTFIGILVMLTGCGSKNDSSSEKAIMPDGSAAQPNYEVAGVDAKDDSYGTGTGSEDGEAQESPESPVSDEDQLTNTSAFTSNMSNLNPLDKIIRSVNLEVETQKFDSLMTTIDTQINQLGGYVESSNISGRKYNSSNDMRSGNMVARVPKDKLDEFINTVDDNANIVNKQEATKNVTLDYINTESHKKSLEIEQERLLALLEKVETLEDIITLETRLSGVRYELQSYEVQLRSIDNLVEYSTVTLNILEVERLTEVAEVKITFWNRIQTGFGDSIYNIGEGLKNFVVWFIVNLPYIIIWVVIIVTIVLMLRRYYRRVTLKNNIENQVQMPGKNQSDNKK